MKLTELEPRWLNDHVFVFRCPHCRKTWISCKNVAMQIQEQIELFAGAGLDATGPRYATVPMRADCAWQISGKDFATLTVMPSIDASASGHWHGSITGGEIR